MAEKHLSALEFQEKWDQDLAEFMDPEVADIMAEEEKMDTIPLDLPRTILDPESLAEWEALKQKVARGAEEEERAEERNFLANLKMTMSKIDTPSVWDLNDMKSLLEENGEYYYSIAAAPVTLDVVNARFKLAVDPESSNLHPEEVRALFAQERLMNMYVASKLDILEQAGEYGLQQIKAYKEKHNLVDPGPRLMAPLPKKMKKKKKQL